MNLNEMIEKMKEAIGQYDLPDEYLKSKGYEPREYYAFGEYHYGITTIPCDMVYPYLVELKKLREEKSEKRGKWVKPTKISGRNFDIPHCSVCNTVPCGMDENTKYCHSCGARMDGE